MILINKDREFAKVKHSLEQEDYSVEIANSVKGKVQRLKKMAMSW